MDLPATVTNWGRHSRLYDGCGVPTPFIVVRRAFSRRHRCGCSLKVPGVEVYEILLLEFGIEIDANGDFTEINPDFVDRSGEIHSAPGGQSRLRGLRSGLNAINGKWRIPFRVVPGKNAFRDTGRIPVLAVESPKSCFFAWSRRDSLGGFSQQRSWGERVPVRYRTDDKNGWGDIDLQRFRAIENRSSMSV